MDKACNTQEVEVRKGPWTMEEDLILINYIVTHGEGVWNSLARSAGLKRTGKSCRLRWLNYLRPDLRRGNITHEEQILIMELHARWGNRWSKIARHLPGRTDNEIKNYWRTRIQKHIKQAEPFINQNFTPAQNASTSTSTSTSTSYSCSEQDGSGACSPLMYLTNNPEPFTTPLSTESNDNDNFWSMEDLWSTQFFNGE